MNTSINYEVLLCCIHMALVFPVIALALFVIMRTDRTPMLEITCDGTSYGVKHKWGSWDPIKAVTDRSNSTTLVTQVRACQHCGYQQFKKTKV